MAYGDHHFDRRRVGRKFRRSSRLGGRLSLVAVVLAVCALFASCGAIYASSHKTRTLTVTRLDDQATRGGHHYLVFTRQGVFQDTDTLLFLKFNSSDVWAQLREGRTYRCETVGWRVPLFSWYPNIVGCKPVR